MMTIIKKAIWYFVFVSVIKCSKINIFNSSQRKDPPISHNHTRQLLELCFSDRLTAVAITSDLIDIIYEIPSNIEKNIPVFIINQVLIGNFEKFYDRSNAIAYPSYPIFILSVETLDYLIIIERHFMYLNYWNSATTVFVIGDTCHQSSKTLQSLWKSEFPISYFICPNQFNNDTSIYTFNPYGRSAPKPWKEVVIFWKPYNEWTAYKISFLEDAHNCLSLIFDRTEFSDGFKHRMSDVKRQHYLRKTEVFIENLLSAVNATPDKNTLNTNYRYFPLIENPSLLDDVNIKQSNILPFYEQGGYVIITKKQSFIPTFDQVIDSFFRWETVTMSSVILAIFFLMMYFNHRYDLGRTVLDLLSFLLDMGISTPMLRTSMRITFMSATLFGLIFNPVLQGQLTSLLTRPGYRNVATLNDLRHHNYQVYFWSLNTAELLRDSKLWDDDSFVNYLHMLSPWEYELCLNKVRESSSAACIAAYSELEDIDEDLYISNEFSFEYRVFTTDQAHPLNEKINKIAMKLFETGHLDYAERRELQKILLKRKKKIEKIKALRKYNQLDLEDFKLAYIAMTLASAWAIIVFGIEVTVKKLEARLDKRSKERELREAMIRRRILSTATRIAIVTQQL